MLSEADLRLLLDLLELREVYHDGEFVVCKRVRGYRTEVAPLQGKLSMMLEMVTSSKPMSADERAALKRIVKSAALNQVVKKQQVRHAANCRCHEKYTLEDDNGICNTSCRNTAKHPYTDPACER